MTTPIIWWRRIHSGRNPLARTSDRVETALVIGVVLTALLVLPVAAALRSDAYAGRMRQSTEQAADRRPVTARLLADAISAQLRDLLTGYSSRSPQWTVEVEAGQVRILGEYRDEAERTVLETVARTVPGVLGVEFGPAT